MAIDKVDVNGDCRVRYNTARVNGKTYGYLLGVPENRQYRATIFLIHGFPDLSMGWRYQIPMLLELGFRVVAPDCLGYGRTDAPEDSALYTFKHCADDIKELASQLGESKIIVCGHDWGAALAYRIPLWCPDLVSHVITICVPYIPPSDTYTSLETIVKTHYPQLRYQLQFRSGELEKNISSKQQIRQFLLTMYGARTADGNLGFSPLAGVNLENFMHVEQSWLMSPEETDYYTNEYSRHGVHGPLNWYRTADANFQDELSLQGRNIEVPVLFIPATRDVVLPPQMTAGMGSFIPQLRIEDVNASHWAMLDKPQEVNEILSRWLKGLIPDVGHESRL